MMKYFKLQMLRDQLDHIPDYGLPNDYKIRHFQKGEQLKWANVETSVNEFNTINQALCHFNDEFGPY